MPKFYIHKPVDITRLVAQTGLDPKILQILAHRGLHTAEEIQDFMNEDIKPIFEYDWIPNIEDGVDLILKHRSDKIRIVGDYDIDGVFATYILLRGLADCPIDADYYIPHRVKDGYGINTNIVQTCINDGIKLIITCDNGITAFDAIKLAYDNGIDVLVTDHHELSYSATDTISTYILPQATCIVTPKLLLDTDIFTELCGAYVAFKLMCVLHKRLNIEGKIEQLVQYAAFATIGDVMPLLHENRQLVKYGLTQMNTNPNLGLLHLMLQQGVKEGSITSTTVGYSLGPCINAAGRLDTAETALQLLLATDDTSANRLATQVAELNKERKKLTEFYEDQAIAQCEYYLADDVIVVLLSNCPEGITGIIAGHLSEDTGKPVIVLTDVDGIAKGSARSIPAYNIHDALLDCSDILIKFGGHAGAAGLSIEIDDVDNLRERLNEASSLTVDDFQTRITIDMPLKFSDITNEFINTLQKLEPCGEANPTPMFVTKDVRVSEAKLVGSNANVLQMKLTDPAGTTLRAVLFKDAQKCYEYIQSNTTLNIIYTPTLNKYQQYVNVQLNIKYYA